MDQQEPQREMVFCHECENEWYRDEHGLICPACQSDFTEIIESNHDPRDDHLHIEEDDDDGSMPDLLQHNPWANAPDPEEGDINQFRIQPNGPNGFTINATLHHTLGGNNRQQQQHQPPQLPGPMGGLLTNFNTMLQGIMGQPAQRPEHAPQGGADQGQRDTQGRGPDNGQPPGYGQPRVEVRRGPGFTFTTTTRLTPRDANGAQPPFVPVDDLHNLLGQMFAPFGPGHPRTGHDASGPGGAALPIHPLHALLTTVFNPAGAVSGDAVYTQEALDRVISQLMEQNATGSAPGPASPEAIARLPKVRVSKEMLGENGKAECSICMDEVGVGETVTMLPCKHWFHGQCVGAWLGEHDTCPHCRMGIERKEGQGPGGDAQRASGAASSEGSGGAGAGASSSRWDSDHGGVPPIPGAWDGSPGPASPRGGASSASGGQDAGRGTRDSPFVVPDQSPGAQRRRPSQTSSSGSGSRRSTDSGGGGGIGERVRGFFGRSSEGR